MEDGPRWPGHERNPFILGILVYCISNYEGADENGEPAKASEKLTVSKSTPTLTHPIQIFTTGSHPPRIVEIWKRSPGHQGRGSTERSEGSMREGREGHRL